MESPNCGPGEAAHKGWKENRFENEKESPPYFLKETRKTLKNSFVLGKQKNDTMFKNGKAKSLLETKDGGFGG